MGAAGARAGMMLAKGLCITFAAGRKDPAPTYEGPRILVVAAARGAVSARANAGTETESARSKADISGYRNESELLGLRRVAPDNFKRRNAL
jgi:hypothetical protein